MKIPMKHRSRCALVTATAILAISGCRNESSSRAGVTDNADLVGAWRSKITFRDGSLAGMKNLEFMYSYNAGGTMTESSNYDEAANSSPPAYGVWKRIDEHTFGTKYVFYTTKAQGPTDGAPTASDWWPAGHGVLTETIKLSDDGQSYTSTIELATFDTAGAPIPGGGSGTGAGTRIVF